MATARNLIYTEGTEGVYHCISRCVRRAFLCGEDKYSGQSFEHRREWIRLRLEQLAGAFAVEVSAYAVMSNHLHVVLRTRPDWITEWDDEEIAQRWLDIFPSASQKPKDDSGNESHVLKALLNNKGRLRELRTRLSSISWFMRCLNEYVARKANREDGVKGRFWEERFKCQALLDESADLACMIYVDLNPIRAKIAETPEESEFTSAFERIEAKNNRDKLDTAPSWLCPIGNEDEDITGRKGMLSLSLNDYLDLLDWTGRQIVHGKRGAIPDHLAPILDRLKINSDKWIGTVEGFGSLFHRAAGSLKSMTEAAKRLGLRWLRGCRVGKTAFELS